MSAITRYNGEVMFNGQSLNITDNVLIYAGNIDRAASRALEYNDVPNRNGGILIDSGYYRNVLHSYSIICKSDDDYTAADYARKISHIVCSPDNYCRLSDSWNSDEYYYAYVPDELVWTASQERDMFKTTINFSRKPQRYLVSGEQTVTWTEGGSNLAFNNEYMPSKPKLRVYKNPSVLSGSGNIFISNGGTSLTGIEITQFTADYIDIDCDTGETAYPTYQTYESVKNHTTVYIPSGESELYATGNITQVDVIPRYWRL